ncbi:CocE/NonD family hydrolase [Streptomyces griseorubiginosus]|uniref:CocE/NonD family hydrolase n=1 Tax=Streptomyces griseorubiginosus TaxID=67304 RepID=UPI0036A2DBF5
MPTTFGGPDTRTPVRCSARWRTLPNPSARLWRSVTEGARRLHRHALAVPLHLAGRHCLERELVARLRDPEGRTPVGVPEGLTATLRGYQHVLVFTTDLLTEDVEVTGRVKAVLFAATDGPSTDWVARLCDVDENGVSRTVTDGIVRVREATPGKAAEHVVDLWSTSIVFRAGHRIRLQATSSNFPRWDRNLNTGEPRRARPPPESPASRSSTTPPGPRASSCPWWLRSDEKRTESRPKSGDEAITASRRQAGAQIVRRLFGQQRLRSMLTSGELAAAYYSPRGQEIVAAVRGGENISPPGRWKTGDPACRRRSRGSRPPRRPARLFRRAPDVAVRFRVSRDRFRQGA